MAMRAVLVALALLVGFGSTDAFAKDAVLVKLRDNDAPKAKPSPAANKSRTTTKRKPVRKYVAKSKPKAKQKRAPEARLRPMP